MSTWVEAVVVAYLLLNAVSLVAFLLDKRSAVRRGRRTSERTLLVLSLLGPFGAVAGMRLFHHKTRKAKFLLVPIFLVIHLVIIVYLFAPPGGRWL